MRRAEPNSSCALKLLVLAVSASLVVTAAAVGSKAGGGSRATTTTTTTTSSASTRTTYGHSIGVQTRYRVVTGAVLTYVYFNGYSYPAARFYYDEYYDDCALRNLTASQLGLNDSSIDNATVSTQLPMLFSNGDITGDLVEFNQSLYNTTNGLVVDPAYCNYTYTGRGAAGVTRLSLALAVLLAVVAMWVSGGSDGGVSWQARKRHSVLT